MGLPQGHVQGTGNACAVVRRPFVACLALRDSSGRHHGRTLGGVTELRINNAAGLTDAAHDAAEHGQVVYLTDSSGRRLAAIVPADVAMAGAAAIEALEDAADLEAARQAATEPGPNVPHSDVLADLVEDEAHTRRTA